MVLAFLKYLETQRNNSPRTRNQRLAAVRSLFLYIQSRSPEMLDQSSQVRALVAKRSGTKAIDWLTLDEVKSILAQTNPRNISGLRDRTMLSVAYMFGLRVSEVLSLSLRNLDFGPQPSIYITGKGRRERTMPLAKETLELLRAWVAARPTVIYDHVFLNRDGLPLTRDGFANRLSKYVTAASKETLSLGTKHVTPHVLRHSCAMHMLSATGDIRKVALWLGHSSIQTTEIYLHADPAEKLRILTSHEGLGIKVGSFKNRSPDIMKLLGGFSKSSRSI